MKKKQFDEVVRDNLSKYNKGKDGWYRNKGGYNHILHLPEKCKTDK